MLSKRNIFTVMLISVLLSACGWFNEKEGEPEAPALLEGAYAIENVLLFDGDRFQEGVTVTVADGRIETVSSEGWRPADGVIVIDGAGKTLLPGLIDAHVHAFSADSLKDALRFGVTSTLDMFTAEAFFQSQKPLREPLVRTDAADLFSAGTLATSPGGHGTQFGLPIDTLDGPEDAEAFVRDRVAAGADYIKIVYEPGSERITSISIETLAALVKAAHANRLLAVAHVSKASALKEALAAGVDGFVHIPADATLDADAVARMASEKIFTIPTLSVIASAGGADRGASLTDDPLVKPWLSGEQVEALNSGFDAPPALRKRFDLATAMENVRLLHEAGAPVLAGTDAPNPGTAYGVSIHDELALLVEAGLSPGDALHAATRGVAEAFTIDDLQTRARIVEGARADLVLVDGDPRVDIGATKRIVRIIKNGFELDRKKSDDIEEAVAKPDLAEGVVSRFDADLTSAFNRDWEPTTDAIAGGASTVAVIHTETGTLRAEGEISTKFFFPWAGAGIIFADDFSTSYDLSVYDTIHFKARGAPRKLSVVFFTRTSLRRPATATFEVTEDWTEYSFTLDEIKSLASDKVYGFSITAGRPKGVFWFEIDDVTFES